MTSIGLKTSNDLPFGFFVEAGRRHEEPKPLLCDDLKANHTPLLGIAYTPYSVNLNIRPHHTAVVNGQ
jgi:hypothetical protein